MPSIFLDAIPWLYADDLELLFHSIIYQDDLTRLHLWNISNEMLANRTKTKCLVFRGNVSIVFNNETLENVDYQKDLGLNLSRKLEWTNLNTNYQKHKDHSISSVTQFLGLRILQLNSTFTAAQFCQLSCMAPRSG